MIGTSPAMLNVFGAIRRAAPTDANVLILGENGTGKELVAREIHRLSPRANEVFLRVDLGALSPQLFESELFGHRRGAFTDAKQDRTGYFRAATGGTLFLDEIGNVPLHLQSKLLTALERREVVPVGAEKPEPIDVRLICATNLAPRTAGGRKSLPSGPALPHQHGGNHRCRRCASGGGHPAAAGALRGLLCAEIQSSRQSALARGADGTADGLAWPGNVRALRHAVERAVILSEGELLAEARFSPGGRQVRAVADEPPSRLDEVEKADHHPFARAARQQCEPGGGRAGPDPHLALPANGEIWPLAVSMPAWRLRVALISSTGASAFLCGDADRLVCHHGAARVGGAGRDGMLIRFASRWSREVARFLDAMAFDDISASFAGLSRDTAFGELGSR